MKKEVSLTILASVLCVNVLAGCYSVQTGEHPETVTGDAPGNEIVVGAIYVGRRNDSEGYTYIHNKAITEAMESLEIPADTNLRIVDRISEEEDISLAVDQLAEQGCDIIFGISEEYDFAMAAAADMYPDIMFCSGGGILSNDENLINYSGKLYEASYIAGVCAGFESLDSGNNDIGYIHIWADEDTENYCRVNAYALGARAVNPDAVIHLERVNSWDDQALIDQAMGNLTSSCGCGTVISSREISMTINWEQFYEFALKTAMNEDSSLDFYSDIGGNYYGGIEDGFIDISVLTESASSEASEATQITTDLLASGQWQVFSGISLEFSADEGQVEVSQVPSDIEDSEGNTVVESGDTGLNEAVIRCYMNYLVDGVIDETRFIQPVLTE